MTVIIMRNFCSTKICLSGKRKLINVLHDDLKIVTFSCNISANLLYMVQQRQILKQTILHTKHPKRSDYYCIQCQNTCIESDSVMNLSSMGENSTLVPFELEHVMSVNLFSAILTS